MDALPVGTILRARAPEDGDQYAVARVVGLHDVRGAREVVLAPYFDFGSPISATMESVLREYEVVDSAAVEAE